MPLTGSEVVLLLMNLLLSVMLGLTSKINAVRGSFVYLKIFFVDGE